MSHPRADQGPVASPYGSGLGLEDIVHKRRRFAVGLPWTADTLRTIPNAPFYLSVTHSTHAGGTGPPPCCLAARLVCDESRGLMATTTGTIKRITDKGFGFIA